MILQAVLSILISSIVLSSAEIVTNLQETPAYSIEVQNDTVQSSTTYFHDEDLLRRFSKKCFCIEQEFPDSKTVTKLINPQAEPMKRLVFYVYEVPDKRKPFIMYIPNQKKQALIPNLYYDENDFLRSFKPKFLKKFMDNNPHVITQLEFPNPNEVQESNELKETKKDKNLTNGETKLNVNENKNNNKLKAENNIKEEHKIKVNYNELNVNKEPHSLYNDNTNLSTAKNESYTIKLKQNKTKSQDGNEKFTDDYDSHYVQLANEYPLSKEPHNNDGEPKFNKTPNYLKNIAKNNKLNLPFYKKRDKDIIHMDRPNLKESYDSYAQTIVQPFHNKRRPLMIPQSGKAVKKPRISYENDHVNTDHLGASYYDAQIINDDHTGFIESEDLRRNDVYDEDVDDTEATVSVNHIYNEISTTKEFVPLHSNAVSIVLPAEIVYHDTPAQTSQWSRQLSNNENEENTMDTDKGSLRNGNTRMSKKLRRLLGGRVSKKKYPQQWYHFNENDDGLGKDTPSFRIIGGSAATGSGRPIHNKGRSANVEEYFS